METLVASGDDSDKIAADKYSNKLEEIGVVCKITTLEANGIDKLQFEGLSDKMATDAIASGSPGNTRREVTKTDCMKIYTMLYQ